MVRDGQLTVTEVRRVVRKRGWILPVCAVGCAALSALVATRLPKKYMSQTVLVSKPPAVPEDLSQRLASMKEQILSRPRLEPVVEKLDLYHADRGKLHMEDLVERLRKIIAISPLEPVPGTQDPTIPGLLVQVSFDNPQRAQEICTEVTSVFMEQNARASEQQAARTASFIGQQ